MADDTHARKPPLVIVLIIRACGVTVISQELLVVTPFSGVVKSLDCCAIVDGKLRVALVVNNAVLVASELKTKFDA